MFHLYYPDLTEPKPTVCRSSLEKTIIEINNRQHSQLLIPLPSLPYSLDAQQFLKKFKFQYSDVTDEENIKLLRHFSQITTLLCHSS